MGFLKRIGQQYKFKLKKKDYENQGRIFHAYKRMFKMTRWDFLHEQERKELGTHSFQSFMALTVLVTYDSAGGTCISSLLMMFSHRQEATKVVDSLGCDRKW